MFLYATYMRTETAILNGIDCFSQIHFNLYSEKYVTSTLLSLLMTHIQNSSACFKWINTDSARGR